MSDLWRNRIIGHEDVAPDQLLANPYNWRLHVQVQQEAVEGSLDELGWIDDVTVNVTTGHVLDGHLRVTLALRRDEPTVPVKYVELSEEEEKLALAVYDPSTAMAATDREKLGALLQEVKTGDGRLQQMLAGLAEREGVYFGWNGKEPEPPEPQVDRAAELQEKWQVQTGDLWVIPSKMANGEHRVICGDCTDAVVVERVMGGELAQMVFTDPPYGVKYGDKLEAANPMHYRVREIENDNLPPDKLEQLIRDAFTLAAKSSVPGGTLYAACPAGTLLPTAIAAFAGSGYTFHWQLVWVKDQLVLGRGDYHFRHENILYGWKHDAAHYFIDSRKQDSVFEIDRPKVSDEHPTMKPVALVEAMINNSSKQREIVYDPFIGSGTTMVASERLGRFCRGIEIEPKYVSVTLERLQGLGLSPQRIE